MAEEELEGSCGWTNKPCDQLILLQPTPDCRYHLEDSAQENVLDRDGALHLTSCLDVELSSQVKDLSLDSAVQEFYEGAPERECCEPADSSLLSHGLCSPLADTITLELPNASYSKTEDSPTIITNSVSLRTPKEDGNRNHQKRASLSCPICQNEYYSPSELKEHFKSHTYTSTDFTCWEGGCFFTTQERKTFLAHLHQEHRVTPVPCSQRTCKLLFSSREEMSLHFRNHFPFHCNSCDFVSSNVKLFTQHNKKHPQGEETHSGVDTLESMLDPGKEASLGAVTHDMRQTNEEAGCDLLPAARLMKRTNSGALNRKGDDEDGECTPRKKKAGKLKTSHNAKTKACKGDVDKGSEHLFKTHMCPECKRCFKKRTHLAEHLHLHFPDPNLQCPNCHKFFTSRSKLKIHMMRESGEKTHRCPLCDYCSVESNALNRHMASIHEEVSNFYSDTYSCPVCQETFKLSQALKDHMKGHKSEQNMLLCFQEGCDQALSDRKEFLRHLKESHGIRGVECAYHACSLLFKSSEEMEQHRRKHYAFHCQECDFACSNKHAFRKHKKNGHPGKEELSCLFCPYKSFNPVEYADHVGKMHANEKIHRCGDCSFATAHKRVLIRHMLLHTGEKPHKCNLCDFTCRDISYLSKHMLTHSSEKNYMCTECGYITKWKHYLNVHMRKHSGDLRYQCNQCSYRCHRADQLSSHKLRHQGKNLICEVCGFGCKRKYELQKHMQIKHSQSSQLPVYQCQHCSYQTKYKQALLNHENCKHTKHREFRCALCPYRTFSNTSLFFHKRKSHGYIPGDKDWLEKYASKQQEVNQAGLLFPYTTEASGMSDTNKTVQVVHQTQKCESRALEDQEQVNQQVSDLQVGEVREPGEDATITVGDEALMATVTLEPVETCGMVINDFPVQLELSAPAELLSKGSAEQTLVTCENSLPTREEMLCFSETLAVGDNREFEEETDPRSGSQDQNEKVMCPTTVQYNQETVLCDLNGKCEELPIHVATLDLQPGDIPVEVQESWADVVKDGVELTIVCESEGLVQSDVPETENSANSPEEPRECSGPESVLEVLRKQDKEQAETLVLEGRVQMLVVQSSSQIYKCEKCSYITKKEGSMLQHSKIGCHVRKTSLVCKECGASFKQQRGLNTHVLKKCPVTLKKKKAVRAAPSSDEPDRCPESSITQTPGSRRGDDGVQVVTVQGSQWSHMAEHCLEEMDTLTPSQTLVNNQFKETTPKKLILDQEETAALTTPDPQTEHGDILSFPSGLQENGKYRYDNGRFRCLLCSFSCSRECTISCHVKENCRAVRKSAHVQRPKEPLSEGALGKREQENLREQDLCQEKDQGSESSADDGSQSMEEDEEREEIAGDAVVEPDMEAQQGARLSCPTCPFMCSQERAMKTHKKKGCLKQGELQCPMCSFRCMSATALKRHRDLHQKYTRNRVQLQCKQCDFVCKQPRCMKQHVRIRHEGVKPHSCRYCDFSTTRRYRLDAHESLHTGVGRISCDSCNRTFGTNSKLRLHQRRVHEKKPTHFCGLCDYSGYSQNDIARHVGSCHSGKPAFPCPVCQASFSSEAALKQHSLRMHQEKATHGCPRCPFTCHSPATLRCHLQKQHLQLECSVCKQSFSRRLDLEEHRRSHFTHRCQECRYAAKDRQQLVRHYSEEHEKSAPPATEGQEGPLRCPFCSFSCHHQLVYDHHVKGHGGTKLYKCVDCEYTTRNKQKITWHSRIHTGEKPYKCHLCTYACADPSRLKYHMRIHKDEKKYLCPECGYKCKWINQLKYHMTKHTGLKPYQCEECDYRTNRADALRIHRETRHRDVRSFICEQCGKAFKTRFLLKTHLKKHSEEKPYVCNICQSGFRWPAGLRHHYLTHTNQQPFFCQYCSYRAKQKFQVVKHLQRHHPDYPDVSKGVGKEPYLSAIHPQGLDNPDLRPTTACEGEALSAEITQT